ncbi:MAG: tetratricopeptide repeat protein [Myxococcales bacterium]|nr:tetratricopeptide repeat protein [Myxococcales bacterium]MCB9643627.1 tetratricopeptide repeat protein [Myxococcales bacterium]
MACLFWNLWFLLFLCAPHCSAPKLIHIRRVLAWEAGSSLRVEAAFLVGDQTPSLRLTLWDVPEQRLDQQELTLPSPLFGDPTPPSKVSLQTPAALEKALFQQALPLLKKRWPQWKGRSLRWNTLSPTTKGTPLLGHRVAVPLSPLLTVIPAMHPWLTPPPQIFLQFRKTEEDAPHLAISLEGKETRPISTALFQPQQLSWRRLSCHRAWCLVEVDHGSATKGHWTTQRYVFQLTKELAQLFHLRGYKAHDLKRYPEAVKDFTRAILLDPTYLDARYNLACANSLLKRYPQAQQQLLHLLAHPAYRKLACKDQDFAAMRDLPAYKPLFNCAPPLQRLFRKRPPSPKPSPRRGPQAKTP